MMNRLENAARQALEALEKTHYRIIDAGLLDQQLLNENFTATTNLREALAEQAAGQAAPPINAAVMPCGSTVTNVYEAYEAGKRAVQQQAAEPVGEQVVVGRTDLAMVRNALQRDADAGKQSRKEMLEMLDASTQQAAAIPRDVVEAAQLMQDGDYRGPLFLARKVFDWVAAHGTTGSKT